MPPIVSYSTAPKLLLVSETPITSPAIDTGTHSRRLEIYGNRNNVIKSKVYGTLAHRTENTLTLRDKTEHSKRRRIMSAGFSDAALRLLEPKILAQVEAFVKCLTADTYSTSWSEQRGMAAWCRSSTFLHLPLS